MLISLKGALLDKKNMVKAYINSVALYGYEVITENLYTNKTKNELEIEKIENVKRYICAT